MHATPPGRRTGLAAIALAVAVALAGCGSDGGSSAATTSVARTGTRQAASTTTAPARPAPGEVIKDILGTEVDPPGATGRTLTLIRYRIGAGAKLAPHIHPGVQLASIRSGILTYTVVSGTVIVRRAGTTTDEQLTAPVTTKLRPGDAVTELDGVVHYGANDTTKPIVIDATLLTRTGEDLAVPVTSTTTTEPAGG